MRFFKYLLIALGIMGLWMPSTWAQSFEWQHWAETQTKSFRPFEYGQLEVQLTTQEGYNDWEYETLIQIQWTSSDRQVKQILYEGFGTAHVSEYRVSVQGTLLSIRYPAADRYTPTDEWVEWRWEWRKEKEHFESLPCHIPPHYEKQVAPLFQWLEQGKLSKVRQGIARLLSTPYAPLLSEDLRLSRAFFQAVYQKAIDAIQQGNVKQAGDLLVDFLLTPPLISGKLRPSENTFVLCHPMMWPCESAFGELPLDQHLEKKLLTSARILEEANYLSLAAILIHQMADLYPQRPGLQLWVGDLMWQMGHWKKGYGYYQKYLSIYRQKIFSKYLSVPPRVVNRLLSQSSEASQSLEYRPEQQQTLPPLKTLHSSHPHHPYLPQTLDVPQKRKPQGIGPLPSRKVH